MKMQFGSFEFPHNPKKITVEYQSDLKVAYYPFRGEESSRTGRKLRVIKCSGVFFAESASGAQSVLDGLMENAQSQKARLLLLPGRDPMTAFLKECAVDYIEDGRIIPYTIVFVEEGVGEGG